MNPETSQNTEIPASKIRQRRTKRQLETDLESAIDNSILRVGYSSLKINDILQAARIEPGIFYNRFNDLDDCRKKYARKFDYWLGDHSAMNEKQSCDEAFKSLIMGWCEALSEDPSFIQLLLWEMTEKNDITIETHKTRERHFETVDSFFEDKLAHLPFNYRYLIILFFGGALYLNSMSKYSKLMGLNIKDQKKEEFIGVIKIIMDGVLGKD